MRIFITIVVIVGCLFQFVGCSTTKNVPEGEQLYVGIDEISYGAYLTKPKTAVGATDSTGVITAVSDVVNNIDEFLSGAVSASPQSAEQATIVALTAEEKALLKRRKKEETLHFEKVQEELEAVLAYEPNGALFGSSSLRSPLQFRLRLYNACYDSHGGIRKWMFRRFAKAPVLISTVSPEMRTKIALNTLHNYGYFSAHTDYAVLTQKNPKKAKISYQILPGVPYRLDSIEYQHFPLGLDTLIQQHRRKSYLQRDKCFSVLDLTNEQKRLETLFREYGYYYFSGSNVTFQADTLMRKKFVQLRVRPKTAGETNVFKPYYIGDMHFFLRRSQTEVVDKELKLRTSTFHYGGKKPMVRPMVMRRAIAHRKGDLYQHSYQESTFEKLAQLNAFSNFDVQYIPRDTTAACDTLDIYVTAMLDKLYDSSFEMNATLKSNDQLGPGVAYSLSKRNAFGGAEKVTWKVYGSYEWQLNHQSETSSSLLNSYEMGTQLSVEYPHFIAPFIGSRHFRFPASTKFALNGDWQNRAKFFQMATVGGSMTYNWHRMSNVSHELNILSLDYNKLISTTAEFDAIRENNPALYVSMRDQFVPSMGYTFTYMSADFHRNPIWLQTTFKQAGNLTSLIYAIGGKDFKEKDKKMLGTPFAQYLKATAEFHNHIKITSRAYFAYRFFGGVIFSYGNSTTAPYADQFYVGGANSVRGFTARALGPGSYRSSQAKFAYMDQTGDVKLEVNAELRARLFGDLHGAVFVDAGNVWLLRKDELRPGAEFSSASFDHVAVGTGLGLRYDLDFLVLRFDVGMALHAPYETEKKGWYNIPKFSDGLAYHFAIGYPF
ncbi:MAG: BamA/TamA family outer membrane protein [Bacteroidaceae bacterium]|nr:BamA/TamA family outer membrane protein [Bacteroidaceae bacterium]